MYLRHGQRFFGSYAKFKEKSKKCAIGFKYHLTEFGFADNFSDFTKWFQEYKVICSKSRTPFCIYEWLESGRPTCFYADIEGLSPITTSDTALHTVRSAVKKTFRDVYRECGGCDDYLVFMEDHRETTLDDGTPVCKSSWHVLGNQDLFIDLSRNGSMHKFANDFTMKLTPAIESQDLPIKFQFNTQIKISSVIDMAVYNSGRAFRTIGSSKTKKECLRGFQLCEENLDACFDDCIATKDIPTQDFCDYSFIDHRPDDNEKNTKNESVAYARRNAPQGEITPEIQHCIDKLQKYYTTNHDFSGDLITCAYGVEKGLKGDVYKFCISGANRHCLTCGRKHDSNNAYVEVSEGVRFRYVCSLGGAPAHITLGDNTIDVPPVAPNEGPPQRVPEFKSVKSKCINIISGMCTGKTYQAEKFIFEHPDHTVVIICPRKSMCVDLCKRFEYLGFELYTNSTNCRRLVIEYESLHKVCMLFDEVYIDEIRSVLTASTCYATNGLNLTSHMETLVELCSKAKHTLLMDADSDLDCAVDIFRDHVFNASETHTIRIERPYMDRKFILKSKNAAYEQMYTDLREGHRVVACFASARQLKATLENLKKIMPEDLIAGYYADSENKQDLYDIMKYWPKYQFIGYTSTITVCLDFTDPVYRVYAFPNKMASSPREMLQSIGRSRNVITGEVIIMLDWQKLYMPLERGYNFQADYEKELKFIIDRRATISSLQKTSLVEKELLGSIKRELTPDGCKWVPSLVSKLWAADSAEQALKVKSWYEHFLWILDKKQYAVEHVRDETPPSDSIVKETNEVAHQITDAEIEYMDEFDAVLLDEQWANKMMKSKVRDMMTTEEQLALRKYEVQKYFQEPVSGEEVVFFEKHKRAILHVVIGATATDAQLYRHYMENMNSARECGVEDFVSQNYHVVHALEELLRNVGYTGSRDNTTEICLARIDITVGPCKENIEKLQNLVGGSCKRTKTLSGMLSSWLYRYIGVKVKARRAGNEKNRRTVFRLEPCTVILAFAKKENNIFDSFIGRKRGISFI